MVVIAIIALLSSVTVTLLSSAQQKSRDSRRMVDVGQIKKALSLYQIDNKIFPIHTTEITITGDDLFSVALESAGVIPEVPVDPWAGYSYTYQSNSSGSDFDIRFCLETNTIPNYSQGCGNSISP